MNEAHGSTLLLIDAGNTRTKLGWMQPAAAPGTLSTCLHFEAIPTGALIDWEGALVRSGSDGPPPLTCITGSNPRQVELLRESFPSAWPAPVALPRREELPLVIDVDAPERVGIDRLLNAIAANCLREGMTSCCGAILIDSGTATTVDCVAPDGRFCGGAILPGFELSARALHQYTALLPLAPLEKVLQSPPAPVGRNTQNAIESGLYWGHVGAVKELLSRLLPCAAGARLDHHASDASSPRHDPPPMILVTGGAAPVLLPHLPTEARHEPWLALQGLAIAMQSVVVELPRASPATRPADPSS